MAPGICLLNNRFRGPNAGFAATNNRPYFRRATCVTIQSGFLSPQSINTRPGRRFCDGAISIFNKETNASYSPAGAVGRKI